jgi:hypothetical protein
MGQFPRFVVIAALSLWVWPLEGAMAEPSKGIARTAIANSPEAHEALYSLPAEMTDPSSAEAANISNQVQAQLQTAQTLSNQGEQAAALAQLNQATALVMPMPAGEDRDRLLSSIGSHLIDLKALDQAQTIAQAMTYETLGPADVFRVELEQSIVKSYIQANQTPQATQLIQSLKPEMRDQYWLTAIETLAKQGDVSEATNLFGQIADPSYFRYAANNAIIQAHIGAEQFAAGQAFLAQQSFLDSLDQASGLNELALWAARANRMEEALAIAQQIPSAHRATTLLTLTELYQARGQNELAAALLAEAATLPYPDDNPSSEFDRAPKIALAYHALGQPEAAQQVLTAAEQAAKQRSSTQPDISYSATAWISAFANIGAFDRASQLLANAPEGSGPEGRFQIATAYTDQHQYQQAITLLSQIPDGVLFPLPEYPDPKVELLNRILNEAMQKEQFATAKRAALVMQNPVDQVRGFMAIATAHQNQPRLDLAVAALDQSLAVANTIEQHGFYADRHSYYQMSNADLLTEIATGYWAAGAPEKAIATVQAALQSEKAFKSDDSSTWYHINSLKTIVKLARDWQQPDLLSAAVAELEAQIGPVPEQTDSPDALVEQITGLINVAYNPGQPLSESVTRNLARLETLRTQATEPQQQLAMLRNLVYVYGLTEQPQLVRSSVEQALPLIAPLPADYRDSHYTNLALAIAHDLDGLSQVLPLLSSPHKQVEVLLQLAQQLAAQDKSTQAIERFDQAVALAETALSTSDRDSLMLGFSNGYTFFNTGGYKNPAPRTAAEVMLMSRWSQSISDPRLRAIAWISFAPNLPPTEAQIAYTELSSTLATIPNDYAKRSLLWENFNQALAYQDFEQATQLANALDGEYRQSALGFVAIASAP